MDRLGVAFLALLAAVLCGGLLLVASLVLIVAKLGFFFLLVLAPFFLLVGIHPGRGRAYLVRWVEVVLGLLVYQIVFSLLVMLLVRVYLLILSSALPWGIQIVVLSLLVLALVLFRARITRLFAATTRAVSPHVVVRTLTGGGAAPSAPASPGAPGAPASAASGGAARSQRSEADSGRWRGRSGPGRRQRSGRRTEAPSEPAAGSAGGTAAVRGTEAPAVPEPPRSAGGARRRPQDAPPLGQSTPPSAPASPSESPPEPASPPPVRRRGQTWGDVNRAGNEHYRRN